MVRASTTSTLAGVSRRGRLSRLAVGATALRLIPGAIATGAGAPPGGGRVGTAGRARGGGAARRTICFGAPFLLPEPPGTVGCAFLPFPFFEMTTGGSVGGASWAVTTERGPSTTTPNNRKAGKESSDDPKMTL